MNQKNHWTKAAALALCAALLLSGCSGGGGSSGSDTEKTDASASSSSDVSSEAPKDYSKYNNYLTVADLIREDIDPILTAYFENVDLSPEFTVTGDYAAIKDAVQFYTAHTYPVEEAVKYAKEDPAYPDADAAMLKLGDSMIPMMEALDDLAAYMRFDDFEDDALAKAPEIHAGIWAVLEDYDTHAGEFLSAIGELADASRDDDRAQMLEDGQMILYHSLTMIHTSEDILEGIWDQLEAANAETGPEDEVILPEIDMTGLSPLFAQFQTAYDDLNKALENEEERGKISALSGRAGDSVLKLYTNKVNALYVQMGALAEAVMGGTNYAEAFDSANEAVGSMIDGYNSLI